MGEIEIQQEPMIAGILAIATTKAHVLKIPSVRVTKVHHHLVQNDHRVIKSIRRINNSRRHIILHLRRVRVSRMFCHFYIHQNRGYLPLTHDRAYHSLLLIK
jgi:hypothetical protein